MLAERSLWLQILATPANNDGPGRDRPEASERRAHRTVLACLEEEYKRGSDIESVRFRVDLAVIRRLADEVDRLALSAAADDPTDQLIAELARLGCSLLEAAAAMASASDKEQTGVFGRRAALGSAE